MKALVFSSYTNAYGVYLGSKKLGVELYTTDSNKTFPIPYKKATAADYLVFTEEASLKKALTGGYQGDFLPKIFPVQMLDDKWALVEWLKTDTTLIQGIKQWNIKEYADVTFPCLLKAKHSWDGNVKLPRGWVCRTEDELLKKLEEARQFDNWREIFFIQEWLGDTKCDVISACGFHDYKNPSRNLTAIVRRIASHNEGLSCSAAVETIEDIWKLTENTVKILDALKFVGPYELEYLFSEGEFRVLEINPRFWMQHAIFLKHNNGLIKRYYSLDTEIDWQEQSIPHTIWIDTIHLFISLAKFRLSFFKFVVKQVKDDRSTVLFWPSIPVALRVIGDRVIKKITNKLKANKNG